MEPFFVKTFWITMIMLWAALIILYFILTNKQSLQRKGHSENYIEYLRKSHTVRLLIIAVVLPLLILLSAWIVSLITGPLTRESQLAYIVLVLILLVVPFKFVDERINQKKIRELTLENGEQVAIDLNYTTLHMIFHPKWELILGLAALLYGVWYLRIEQWIIYLFLLFPWFMYLNIRGTRYQTRPYMTDNYKYMYAFNIFSFLFFLVYFCIYYLGSVRALIAPGNTSVIQEDPGSGVAGLLLLALGFVIFLGLIGRIAVYISNYSRFNRAMKGEAAGDQSSPVRKWLLFLGFLITFPAVSGLIVFSGGFNVDRLEVGVVIEKYMVDHSGTALDTLLIVDQASAGDVVHKYPVGNGNQISLGCTIRLSRSGRLVTYQVCCADLFRELPVGPVIKFEYGSGPSIIRLIDH
jgi:hypothetical protein